MTANQDRTRLWLCVGAAFAVLIGAWIVMFRVARAANIQPVPPVTQGGVRP